VVFVQPALRYRLLNHLLVRVPVPVPTKSTVFCVSISASCSLAENFCVSDPPILQDQIAPYMHSTATVLFPIIGNAKVQIRAIFSGVNFKSEVTKIRPAVHELKHVEFVIKYVLFY